MYFYFYFYFFSLIMSLNLSILTVSVLTLARVTCDNMRHEETLMLLLRTTARRFPHNK